jgi:hypothetical protein
MLRVRREDVESRSGEEKVERAKRGSCDEKNGQWESGREKSLWGSWLFGRLLLRAAFLQEASMLGPKNILNSNSSTNTRNRKNLQRWKMLTPELMSPPGIC